jgi:flavin-dependent dehydrogenase
MNTNVDVLIIGAGPAGSTAAALLHREGFRLLVVEKQKFPRFVIGESLLPHSMDLLQEAGLLANAEERKFMHKGGAVFLRGNETCNFDFSSQFTAGWSYTYQVPRADFDKTLADAVAAQGVEILYEHGVTAVHFGDTHAIVTIQDPTGALQTVTAKFVLDCSGYGRVLPRLLNLEEPSSFPVREALFTHLTGDQRPTGREEGKIWICLHPGGAWLWIIPFSDGRTSVGAVAEPVFFAKYPGTPEESLRAILDADPNARARLAGTKFLFSPQRITGYACSVKQLCGPRFALVGNATEFLDPIFSSGVTLALASANRAAKLTARQLRGEAVDWATEYAGYVMQGINTFRAYVAAWYDGVLPEIFFAPNKNPDIMRQICSVLAGYVWDTTNPYVAQAHRALPLLAQVIRGNSAPAPATQLFAADTLTAYEAKSAALRLAYAPMAFQAARVLRTSGLLELVLNHKNGGSTLPELVAASRLPRYGVKVLLEAGLGIGLLCLNNGRYTLTKLGHFILRDPTVRASMDFAHHICYRGLFELDQAVVTGRPTGLKTLGDWNTVYEALASLPAEVRQSWFAFDQHFSDVAFPDALPLVFADRPRRLLDVGANTGKWAVHCVQHDPTVRVTMVDLPGQLAMARQYVEKLGLTDRIDSVPLNVLDDTQAFPAGYDVIWMSQFLDCFSEDQIVSILRRAARAMAPHAALYILEPYWDRQRHATAAFCLQQTSIYFTCIANGNSQMYAATDMLQCVEKSGLKVVADRDGVGLYHTLFKCRQA